MTSALCLNCFTDDLAATNRELGVHVPSWPMTLGSDGAGIVVAVGEDVNCFKQGDEVFGCFTSGNNKTASFQVGYLSNS